MTDATSDNENEGLWLARPGRLIGWLAAGFVACAAVMIALPHQPYIRFQALSQTIHNRVQWSFERIHFDPTPIDVAVIGNSRMGAGVNAPALSDALSEQLGRKLNVVNLSTPQEGRNLHWTMAEELIMARPEVKLILLSVIEQEPRTSHPAFRNLGSARDILTAPLLLNRDWGADLLYLPFRQASLFFQSLFPGRFGLHREFDAAGYSGPDFDTTVSFYLPDGNYVERDVAPPEAELRSVASKRLNQITRPLLPDSYADYEFVVERDYVRKIAELAKSRGIAVGFVYLPIYTNDGPIHNRDFYSAIGPVFEARQLINAAAFFSDYGHLNHKGALSIVPWLAEAISAELMPQADAANAQQGQPAQPE